MGILGTIFSKIFPPGHPAIAAAASGAPAAAAAPAPAPTSTVTTDPTAPAAETSTSAAAAPVDVEAILSGMASKDAETLNWRTSIVDLMKLLQLDSSLANRKALAQELHYTGNTEDSAAMNMWLQKEVMQKLADNGGQVPADLRS